MSANMRAVDPGRSALLTYEQLAVWLNTASDTFVASLMRLASRSVRLGISCVSIPERSRHGSTPTVLAAIDGESRQPADVSPASPRTCLATQRCDSRGKLPPAPSIRPVT